MKALSLLLGLALVFLPNGQTAPSPSADAPAYTPDGSLIAPSHYREWIYLTSGMDMSYAASAAPTDRSVFDNVFVNPSAYHSFLATGRWPDQTTLVLESRRAESPVSINKRGHTQSIHVVGMEIHVKDHGHWNFYELNDGSKVAELIRRPASCYSCHEAHGAVDTTFVQFYPTLLPLAAQQKTFSAAYRSDLRSQASRAESVPK